MKFNEYFKEVKLFTAGLYVVSGYYDKDVAHKMIQEEFGESILIENMDHDKVRFGFPPWHVEDCDPEDGAVWYTGAGGKGSKPVWIYDTWKHRKIDL